MEASEPETESASTYTRFMEPAVKQTLESRNSGGMAEPLSAMPPPKPPSRVVERAPQPYVAAAPKGPPSPTAAETSAEPRAVAQTPEAAKPPKNGNRFIRVLDKLNPFRRSAKNDSGDHAEATATERVTE